MLDGTEVKEIKEKLYMLIKNKTVKPQHKHYESTTYRLNNFGKSITWKIWETKTSEIGQFKMDPTLPRGHKFASLGNSCTSIVSSNSKVQ